MFININDTHTQEEKEKDTYEKDQKIILTTICACVDIIWFEHEDRERYIEET